MKNIKNTVAAMGLMAVLGLGATTANAGLMLSDRSAAGNCSASSSAVSETAGIIIVGASSSYTGILMSDFTGILMSDFTGILMSDVSSNGCQTTQAKDGILMSD